jgi:hypothetical protein
MSIGEEKNKQIDDKKEIDSMKDKENVTLIDTVADTLIHTMPDVQNHRK